MAIQPGTNLGQYRIVEQLGRGGMATVYKAYQPSLDRYVAIKVLPSFYAEDPEYLGRFRQEAISIARLRHPNIMAVHDYGEEAGVTYIVSEYVPGGTLARYLGMPVDVNFAVYLLKPVASALDYAHSRKPPIIHRDIKPSNILLAEDGTPVVSDFGIAKMVGGGVKTQTGLAVGTPEYMAPEQALGKATAASDIYSLGIVMYQLLTGRVPYSGDTPMAIMLAHINNPLPMPRSLRPEMTEAVEAVILKALSREPEDRFRTAGAMVQALENAATAVATSTPPVEAPTVVRELDTPPNTGPAAANPSAAAVPVQMKPESKQPATEQEKKGRETPRWLALAVVPLVLAVATALWALSGRGGQDGQPTATPAAGAQAMTSTAAALFPSTAGAGSPTVPAGFAPTGTVVAMLAPTAGDSAAQTAISIPSTTATDTPSPEPTATPTPDTPTATATPQEPTPTPTAAEPTSTSTPRPTPTPTEEPTATAIPQPSTPGLITDFESFGTWLRGDQPNGSFTQSGEQVHGGGYSGKLSYDLPDSESDYVVFTRQPPDPLGGRPNVIRAWVYEDGSGHFLNGLIKDSQGERWQVSFGRLTGQGWRQVEAIVDAGQPWPSGHWDGPSNGAIDYPIAFAGLVLDRIDGPLSGTIYIDDITYAESR